ncbi:putative oxidoreductase [Neomicrococcus aestuarii]|uniref:Putative oxidoreductase n=1 Tax=Neomicrococcus aestuarii TaxID=556325 RepID=A0A7W8TU79_9MICC|nr:aldo/keto reductase [Neomicrococcus aestuarii]MBB5512987.1 putative oxidoreductase [Neomicrococcus aestuarii]
MTSPNTPLIYGCMGLGGPWEPGPLSAQPDATALVDQAHAAIDAALAAGITTFDHADIYKHGRAEEVFGRVLAERPDLRDRISIQSKVGIILGDPQRYDSSRAHVSGGVVRILERLGISQLDALLIHRPDPLTSWNELAETLSALREEGLVKRFGVSNMSAAQLAAFERAFGEPPAVAQVQLSLQHRNLLESSILFNATSEPVESGFVEYCGAKKVEIQAWSPLAGGLFDPSRQHDDASAADPAGSGANALAASRCVVQELMDRYSCSSEAVVLAFLLKLPWGVRPVIGSTNPARIAASADAATVAEQMSREDWYRLWTAARGVSVP